MINLDNHEILILGAGHFGQQAFIKLGESFPETPITIVDRHSSALQACLDVCKHPVQTICADGIDYLLSESMLSRKNSLWIVPSIPVHVTFEWILAHFTRHNISYLHLPDNLLSNLPNTSLGNKGTIYMSHATFRCPDNCPEPVDRCFYTQLPRQNSLFETLQNLTIEPYTSVVIQSHQLMPGVGGYLLSDLYTALSQVEIAGPPVLVSTACRCHGVMNGFSWKGHLKK